MSTQYDKEGLPEDLIEGDRVRVTSISNQYRTPADLYELNRILLDEIKLLNLRFEEAFQTGIDIRDMRNGDY